MKLATTPQELVNDPKAIGTSGTRTPRNAVMEPPATEHINKPILGFAVQHLKDLENIWE